MKFKIEVPTIKFDIGLPKLPTLRLSRFCPGIFPITYSFQGLIKVLVGLTVVTAILTIIGSIVRFI